MKPGDGALYVIDKLGAALADGERALELVTNENAILRARLAELEPPAPDEPPAPE